jgi:hypothetical protein
MKGTWTTKPEPKVLETILGTALIVLIILVGLAHEALSSGADHPTRPAATPAPSAASSPHR